MSSGLPSPARRRFLTPLAEPTRSSRNLQDWQREGVADRNPDDPATGVLWGLWGSQPDHLFVVGDAGLVLHGDGQGWTREPSDTRLPLHAVCGDSAGNLVAVGWMGVICERRAGHWVLMQGGTTDASGRRYQSCRSNQPLFACCTDPAGDFWAAGDHGRVVRRVAGNWQEIDTGVQGHLRGILALPDGTLMACGRNGLIIRWDGEAWHPMPTATGADLNRLWGQSPDDVYALGGRHDPNTNAAQGCLLHFNGERWSQIPSRGRIGRLRGMASDARDTILVGDRGGVYRLAHGVVERIGLAGEEDLLDVVLFADHGLAIGDRSTILRSGAPEATGGEIEAQHRTRPQHRSERRERGHRPVQSRWSRVAQGITERTLHAAWTDPSGRLFVVGDSGTILTGEGNHWERMEAPNQLSLRAIWGSSEHHIFACGQQASLLHFDGSAWREVYRLGIQQTALAMTGFGPHDVFVAGDDGLFLRYDGTDWQRLPSGTKRALYGLWGLDAEHLLAVGDLGLVLRWNGQQLDAFQAGNGAFLFDVWGDGLSNIHVVGQAGTLAHFDGMHWTASRFGSAGSTRADLMAVTGRPGQAPLAVGSGGVALRAQRDQDGQRRWRPEATQCEVTLRALCMDRDGNAYAVGDGGSLLYRPVG